MLIDTIVAVRAADGPPRVLLVDPEPRVRQRLGYLLRIECSQVIEAASVDGALAAVEAHRPTVIATQLVLEGEPFAGFRLAAEAKQLDPNIQTVVYLDRSPDEDIRRRAKLQVAFVVQVGEQVAALLSAVRTAHDNYGVLAAPRHSAATNDGGQAASPASEEPAEPGG